LGPLPAQADQRSKSRTTDELIRQVSRQRDGKAKRATRIRAKVGMMESFSIWHWVIMVMVIAMGASPIFGIIRGVQNGAVLHAIASVFVPVYGLIYFFAAKPARK
jgi:hypothetical protein